MTDQSSGILDKAEQCDRTSRMVRYDRQNGVIGQANNAIEQCSAALKLR